MLESLCSSSSFKSVAFQWHWRDTVVLHTGLSSRNAALRGLKLRSEPLFVTVRSVQVSAKIFTILSFSSSASVPVRMLPNIKALASSTDRSKISIQQEEKLCSQSVAGVKSSHKGLSITVTPA